MIFSWWPVVWLDILGAAASLAIGVWCVRLAWIWSRARPDDHFRHYAFLLTVTIGAFAVSRSFGHIVKQFLLLTDRVSTWHHIAPFSGAVNTATFVVIFAFSIYFDRLRQIKLSADETAVALAASEATAVEAHAAEQRLQTIFDGMDDAVAIIDETYHLLFFNRKFKELNPEARTGCLCYECVYHRRTPCGRCRLAGVIAEGRIVAGEAEWRDREMTLHVTEIPLAWSDGRRVKLTVLRDITKRKQLERQLLQSQKMEAIGNLAAGVAHDFNNILTAISGYGELLSLKLAKEGAGRREVEEIKKAVARAASLTRQLLAFSRRQPLEPTVVDLNVLVGELRSLLDRLIGEDVAIALELADALPPARMDRGQIEQVITNLVVNARDAMPRGGRITIRTGSVAIDEQSARLMSRARSGRFLILSVADTGSGMDQTILAKIFDPFFTTKGRGHGTGLGLAVAYGIVDQHDGWINVYSEPGQGSVFRIYLPAVEDEEAAITPPPVAAPMHEAGHGEHVLLVEDEKDVGLVAQEMMRLNGYRVTMAASVAEAMALFEEADGDVDLIFSDMVLPDGNGLELIEALRNRKPGLAVLLTSGYADEKSQWPAIREKGLMFLQKPFTLSSLLEAVGKALDGDDGEQRPPR